MLRFVTPQSESSALIGYNCLKNEYCKGNTINDNGNGPNGINLRWSQAGHQEEEDGGEEGCEGRLNRDKSPSDPNHVFEQDPVDDVSVWLFRDHAGLDEFSEMIVSSRSRLEADSPLNFMNPNGLALPEQEAVDSEGSS